MTLIVLTEKPIMALAFGKSFAPYASLVAWQAIYTLLALIYRGLQYYYRTVGSTGVLARSSVVVSLVSVGLCVILAQRFGATGGMVALVIGQVLNVVIPLKSIVFSKRTEADA